MDFSVWLAFFAASWAISISPGAGAVAAMSAGLNHGVCALGVGGFQVVRAQTASPDVGWQQCARLAQDKEARLSCFDRWASEQTGASTTPMPAASPPAAGPVRAAPAKAAATPPVTIVMTAPAAHDCTNPRFSELSRFWELEAGSDCGTFSIRGYRPISLSLIASDSVNLQPSSTSADHTAAQARSSTMRVNF